MAGGGARGRWRVDFAIDRGKPYRVRSAVDYFQAVRTAFLRIVALILTSALGGFPGVRSQVASMPEPSPELLRTARGEPVGTVQDWENIRRPELIALFEDYVYGHTPAAAYEPATVEVLEASDTAFGGRARRRQVRLTYTAGDFTLPIDLLLYLPSGRVDAPIVFGYNFYGNHTITDDPAVVVPTSWTRTSEALGIESHRPSATDRGVRAYRWAIGELLDAGIGLATVYCGDVDPDRPEFNDGAHRLIDGPPPARRDSSAWGTIGAWAWGASEVMDYLARAPELSGAPVVLFGHSRLGKAALWAGARDGRFAAVISNDSGCGGAAMFRPGRGESIADITTSFPHWFADRFDAYAGREAALPIDQHALLALVAPRPLYVASATEDGWADPLGEYHAAVAAGEAYRLYGHAAPVSPVPPPPDSSLQTRLGYHVRTGPHDVTPYDWRQFARWINAHVGG